MREGHPPLIRKPERDQSRELAAARPKIGQVGKLNQPWVTVDPSRAHPSILPFAKVILHDRTEAFLSQAATTWGSLSLCHPVSSLQKKVLLHSTEFYCSPSPSWPSAPPVPAVRALILTSSSVHPRPRPRPRPLPCSGFGSRAHLALVRLSSSSLGTAFREPEMPRHRLRRLKSPRGPRLKLPGIYPAKTRKKDERMLVQ